MAVSQLAEASVGLASYLRAQTKATPNVNVKNTLKKLGDNYSLVAAFSDEGIPVDQQIVMDCVAAAGIADPLRSQLVTDILYLGARSPRVM